MVRATVILVHGLWMTGIEMSLLGKRLAQHDFDPIRFRYPTLKTGLDANLASFAQFIQANTSATTHIIGHSLGGVLALQTLQRYPDLPISKVICLGSPLTDSSAARRVAKSTIGNKLIGRMLHDAVLHCPLTQWRGLQAVGVIAGERRFGLTSMTKLLTAPSDGVVTIAETCLPGITDHLVMRVGHGMLVLSEDVAEQCAYFLQHGQFKR